MVKEVSNMSILTTTINQRQDWATRQRGMGMCKHAMKSLLEYTLTIVIGFAVYSHYDTILEFARGILTR